LVVFRASGFILMD